MIRLFGSQAHWLTGNRPMLIFHRSPASAASCTGGSHGTGRKACMWASALIRRVAQSGSELVLCPVLSRPVPAWPVLAWPGMAWQWLPRSRVVLWWIFHAPSVRQSELMLTAALAAVLLFIFVPSPTWTCIQMR